jgi:uncharacterized protein YbaR (Trm112 family)
MASKASPMSKAGRETPIDPKLLELLVCPLTKASLSFDAARNELISKSAKLAFPIRDGIPIMLPSEARIVEEDPPGTGRAAR